MPSRKIACLGGGSLYFPRLLNDIALEPDLAGSELVLYDLDLEKVEIMAEFGRQLASNHDVSLRIRATTDLPEAVDGADFAVSSIGGSGASITADVYGSQYHSADMHIPARYGIHQVIGDTCGPAGMMMGLRSIPAYIAICREMEQRCPGVILLNHSNPMAVVMRAGLGVGVDVHRAGPDLLRAHARGIDRRVGFSAARRCTRGPDLSASQNRRRCHPGDQRGG